MKLFLLVTILVLQAPLQAQDPKDYLWKKRVLLLFPGNKSALQKSELTKEFFGLEERDVIILEANTATFSRYAVKPGQFTILLLGKDGDEKFRSEQVVKAESLFTIIDAMPMRKEELRSRK